jgi:hypothetical protein
MAQCVTEVAADIKLNGTQWNIQWSNAWQYACSHSNKFLNLNYYKQTIMENRF